MAHPLRLFDQGGYTSSFIAAIFLTQMLINTCPLLYTLKIRIVYGFGIKLRGMCELPHIWKPQPQARVYQLYTTLYSVISVINHGAAL